MKEQENRKALLYRFRHARLRFQRSARLMRQQFTFPLSTYDSVVLTFLTDQPGEIHATAICQSLGLVKSRLSTLLMQLERDKLVVSRRSMHDQRSRVLELTPRGAALVRKLAELNNAVSEKLAEGLSEAELARFVTLLDVVVQGLGAKPEVAKAGEHPLLFQQRRLAKSTGTATANYMGTGLEVIVIQLFLDLEQGGEVPFKELASRLPIATATFSRLVQKFTMLGALKKRVPHDDKREVLISFTQEGRELHDKVMAKIDATHRVATAQLSDAELLELIELLERVNQRDRDASPGAVQDIAICKNQDFYLARQFLVEQLVARKQHQRLSAELLPDSSFCTTLRHGEQLAGMIEIRRGVQSWNVEHCLILPEVGREKLAQFFNNSLALLFTKTNCRRVEVLEEEQLLPLLKVSTRLKGSSKRVIEKGKFLKGSSWV